MDGKPYDQSEKEDEAKERERSENRKKDRKHSQRDKSQLNYSSTDKAVRVTTDTEITKEIRKKVIRIEIEIRVLIIAAGALAEIEKEIETVIKIGDMITKVTEIRSGMKEI